MQTLGRFGRLAWFKLSAGHHPVYGYQQVPYMGWRYDPPQPDTADLVRATVARTPTQVDWQLDTADRNWLLAPSVLLSKEGAETTSFQDRVRELVNGNQDFCKRAQADLDAILGNLERLAADQEPSSPTG